LRQVIINTHSPAVVSAVADESLYLAKSKESFSEEFRKKITHTSFSALKNTWKTNQKFVEITSFGEISAYLDKVSLEIHDANFVQEDKASYQKGIQNTVRKRSVIQNALNYKLDFGNS